MTELVIGTRGSELAMWQANYIHDALMTSHAGLQVRMEVIKTQGDQLLHGPLHKLGDKGLFTKEIEQALVEGKIDLAVHSLKDLPTRTADGLTLGAITAREDPADALVARHGWTLETLPPGAGIFTSSLRRQAQVLHLRADLHVWPVRGNVPTRLRKFDKSESQGILFARAGLVRLGLGERITQRLDPGDFLPACGQGALAVEVRCDDERTRQLVAELDDATSRCACTAERAFLGRLHGGCQVPVGAFARFAPGTTELTVSGMVANLDGSRMLRRTTSGPCTQAPQAEEIGLRLAELLLADGCQGILDEVLRQSPPAPEVEA